MSTNPYDNPAFAREYVLGQTDRAKNRYEWEVTHPATLQFLDESVESVLDYGCGSGIFSAGITQTGRKHFNPNLESVGTDASTEMLRYAELIRDRVEGITFEKWDASVETSPLQDNSFSRVFAKLVLNYVSNENLHNAVMPRLRECLSDDGLLIAVLPNPLREVGYNIPSYENEDEISVNVGNFSKEMSTTSFRHTYENMITAANNAGFVYGAVLGLPDVRFEPYKKQLMKIAHPMPMILDTLNAAKRWVYVFGATEASAENFDSSVERFENWRISQYPEIADRAHMRVSVNVAGEVALPVQLAHDALYDYVSESTVVALEGHYAEHLKPEQKLKLARELAKRGVREKLSVDNFIVTI